MPSGWKAKNRGKLNSPVAPKFNIVSKPNDWSKTVLDAAKRIESGDLSETKQLQQEYWAGLKAHLTEAKSELGYCWC